jgi:hypothetical protein
MNKFNIYMNYVSLNGNINKKRMNELLNKWTSEGLSSVLDDYKEIIWVGIFFFLIKEEII